MQTKSVRAKVEDVLEIEKASRELAVTLNRRITVSEFIHALMEYKDDAKERIKKEDVKIS